MGMTKHATRAAYNHGCRCQRCVDANAANVWARRRLKEGCLDRGVLSTVSVEGPITLDKGETEVPATVLAQALNNLRHSIEIEVLTVVWFRARNKER